jgi:hypothetical protein
VRLQVAKIAANGSMRRWVIDTAGRSDADRWEELIARVPAVPPPYRAAPGSAVYDIRVDDDKFLVAEHDLSGPLSDLVRAVLIEGDAVLAAWRNRVRRAQPVMLQQHTGLVTVMVTQIVWEGSIRRRARDTCSLTDAGCWQAQHDGQFARPRPPRESVAPSPRPTWAYVERRITLSDGAGHRERARSRRYARALA